MFSVKVYSTIHHQDVSRAKDAKFAKHFRELLSNPALAFLAAVARDIFSFSAVHEFQEHVDSPAAPPPPDDAETFLGLDKSAGNGISYLSPALLASDDNA